MLLIMTPIFYYYQFGAVRDYFVNIWDVEAQEIWERQYLDPWWKFFALSGFMTWILLIPAGKKLIENKFKLTDMQILYVLWILAFLPLLIFRMGIWRMISYQIVPLSLLVASVMSNENRECLQKIQKVQVQPVGMENDSR